MRAIPMIALLPLLLAGGCSSTGYLAARGRDAADVFTLTVGAGDGVKARVGPIQVAAFHTADLAGLRAGEFFSDGDGLIVNDEVYAPIPLFRVRHHIWRGDQVRQAIATGRPMKDNPVQTEAEARLERRWITRRSKWTRLFGEEGFSHGTRSVAEQRGKNILAKSPTPITAFGIPAPFYTQIEVAAGVLLTVRAGVNPGELLDFVIGWVGLDLYGDDELKPVAGEVAP